MESEYLKVLLGQNPTVAERYRLKLKIINNVDPFTLNNQDLDYSTDLLPPVTYLDIVAYLTLTHSYYTKQQMKAFKSLQSYKYFEAGFVLKAGTKIINDLCIFVGQVKHSQKASKKALDVWSIIAKDGSVLTAHCTCMAGTSEVCSHVGAILFMAEFFTRRKEELSCTDVLSRWNMPSMSTKVPIVRVQEVDWGKSFAATYYPGKGTIPPVTDEELVNILKKVSDLEQTSAMMRIVEPFASEISKQSTVTLPLVFDIYSEDNINKNYMELMKLLKSVNFKLTNEEIVKIEIATRKQSENENWYKQRAGRITASKFKMVCNTNKQTPSLTLIKSLCYPTKMLFSTKATLWGITHEHVAVEEYLRQIELENHENFIINEVGLMISKEYNQLAASPDRLVFCECCKGGCLEIKCPYLLYTNNINNLEDYLKLKSCCLAKENNAFVLKKNHTYYYQVQMQMFVSTLPYCDFVIWSPNLFFKQRILPDFQLWEEKYPILLKFHSEVILPELLGRYFTRNEGTGKVMHWCTCKGVDDGRPMVKCDMDNCDIEWFHFECVGLTEPPINVWYCNKCSVL